MAWESLEKKANKVRSPSGMTFRQNAGTRKYPQTAVTICFDTMAEMGVKHGDYVEVLFNFDEKKIGFRRSNMERGFRLAGRCLAGILKFRTPMNKNGILLANADQKTFKPVSEKGVFIVQLTDSLHSRERK